jgi:CarboxypepD_reg-like domain
VKGSSIGTMTDNSGKFLLRVPETTEIIRTASVGYKEKFTSVGSEKINQVKIKLSKKNHNLSEVTIKPSKRKYKKKGNAAVDFVKRVIASKNQFSTKERRQV